MVLKDFSTLEPEPVTVRIGNGDDLQEVDLTVFPAFLSLKTAEFVAAHPKILEIKLDESTDYLVDTLGQLNPEITKEFLMEKCSEKQVASLFFYIIQRHLAERTPPKNGKKAKNP